MVNVTIVELVISEIEDDDNETSPDVEWQLCEYTTVKMKKIERKKMCLIKKTTKPKHMFQYLKKNLENFAGHKFRLLWQANQLQHLKNNLPENDVICIHDC